MKSCDTWALPLVKEKLLKGEFVTQVDMLKATDGKAWRLSAAIYYLRNHDWEILGHENSDRTVSYYLTRQEIRRQQGKLKALEDAA